MYLTPLKPMPGKNGAEPKIAGGKVQPRLAPLLKVFSYVTPRAKGTFTAA